MGVSMKKINIARAREEETSEKAHKHNGPNYVKWSKLQLADILWLLWCTVGGSRERDDDDGQQNTQATHLSRPIGISFLGLIVVVFFFILLSPPFPPLHTDASFHLVPARYYVCLAALRSFSFQLVPGDNWQCTAAARRPLRRKVHGVARELVQKVQIIIEQMNIKQCNSRWYLSSFFYHLLGQWFKIYIVSVRKQSLLDRNRDSYFSLSIFCASTLRQTQAREASDSRNICWLGHEEEGS